MNKLATIALLALSLFTAACTETEDTDLDSVEIDEPTDLSIDGESNTLSERAPAPGSQSGNELANAGVQRPAHAPGGEPTSDRLGTTGLDGAAPGQPGTGTAECVTQLKLGNGEPVIGAADPHALGIRARDRFLQMRKIAALRPVADRVQ